MWPHASKVSDIDRNSSVYERVIVMVTKWPVSSFSLIDRRGFVPPDELPAAPASETELLPFTAKNDANMVGWTGSWSLSSPDCPIAVVCLFVCFSFPSVLTSSPTCIPHPNIQTSTFSPSSSAEPMRSWFCVPTGLDFAHFPVDYLPKQTCCFPPANSQPSSPQRPRYSFLSKNDRGLKSFFWKSFEIWGFFFLLMV